MREEAIKRGITCTTFGDSETILMEKDGHSWYVRGSRTSLQSSVGRTIADQKPLTKKIFKHFGLPTANGLVIDSYDKADLAKSLLFPLVAKPLASSHGQGVIVGISSIPELQDYLKDHSPALVEESLTGTEYRILCVDYKFVAAAFRKPAFVVGDGTQSISELIAVKNQHPWRGEGHQNNLSLIKVDEIVMAYLGDQGLSLESIPAIGQEVPLRKTANLSTGGEAWDVSDSICAENISLFEKIARACDLNTLGIDIMCQSLSMPISTQERAGVIEVNASPGLRMHHYPLQGTPRNVAGIILDMVERYTSHAS